MRGKHVLIVGVAVAASVLSGPAASAKPVFQDHFTDVGTSPVDFCDGITAQEDFDVRGSLLVNLRGSSPHPYVRSSTRGTIVTTNLGTGRTVTEKFTANSRDLSIVENGDGTITITAFGSGGSRYYDSEGSFVARDPGMTGFRFDLDYGGTPLDPEDDEEVPGSFEIVRPSTGNSEVDFCALLAEHTS